MRSLLTAALGAGVLACASTAFAQSFNIDMNTGVTTHVAHGAPSDVFGGAASQPGFWNAMTGNVVTTITLDGLDGVTTGVQLNRSSAVGGNFAFDNPNTTGDFELLLDDGHDLSGEANGITYTFSGLAPGPYQVYTYAIAPDFGGDITVVAVTGASPPNPQTSGGPMPNNAFVLGITHTLHDVMVGGDGLLTVHANGSTGADFGTVNGFQLVLIPEPATLGLLGLSGLALIRRRR